MRIALLILFCYFSLVIGSIAYLNMGDNGIYAHPSGEAVYLKGESCVINATQEIDEQLFLDLMLWCSIQHMTYLSEVKAQGK